MHLRWHFSKNSNNSPEMSKYASGKIGGPLSMGFPEPLKMRPSMSSETGVFKTCNT